MGDSERRRRAEERRRTIVIRRAELHDRGPDPDPIRGAEAVSLVTRLTRESWAMAGREIPTYDRAHTPYRFVPGRLT